MDILDDAKKAEMEDCDRALANHFARTIEPAQDIENGIVYCIRCGREVERERLAVKPNAARCVECQTIHEQLERRNGHGTGL